MSKVFKFAWKNIWRNRKRTLFTLLAIMFSMILFVFVRSYINGLLANATDSLINTNIGHVRVVHNEYLKKERLMPKEFLISNVEEKLPAIKQTEGVQLVDPRIRFPVLISIRNESEGCLAIGIDPVKADKTIKLSSMIKEGEYIKPGAKELIIGKGLADKLNIVTGDELLIVTTDINYSTYALPFIVKGIFESGFSSMDKHLIYIPLTKAAEMIDADNSAHELLLYLDDRNRAEEVAGMVTSLFSKDIKVLSWTEDKIISGFLPVAKAMWGKILGIIMLITGLVILNTMLMSVMERFHEIGILKAMGMKNREIILMIFTEASIIGTIGSVAGGIIGGLLSLYTEINGINIAATMKGDTWDKIDIPIPVVSKIVYPDITPEILAGSILFGIALTLAAVLWPAFKTIKMKPVDAFRTKLNL